ncbi:MAG: PRC-barrel domain-containing protein [Pirellulaceae bacterium]
MKWNVGNVMLWAGVGAFILSTAGTSQGQDEKSVDVQAGPVRIQVDRELERVDRVRARINPGRNIAYRSSKIIGMPVRDAAGNDLGSIYDLVIDLDSGMVRYAALAYGGLLDGGDKLFAIPWDTLETRPTSDDAHELVLNVDPEVLRAAPGFPQDRWPEFADARWGTEIDDYYRKFRRNRRIETAPGDQLGPEVRERAIRE